MIDKNVFVDEMRALERRFGKELHEDELARYREYLGQRMGTEDFVGACRALWATREFFPRPADFLTVAAGSEWSVVIDAIREHNPPNHTGWEILHDLADEWTKEAVRSLGGLPALVHEYNRSPVRARKVWMEAYDMAVVEDAAGLLPEVDRGPELPPGFSDSEVVTG